MRRPWAWLSAVAAVAFGLAVLHLIWAHVSASSSEPGRGAAWIWAAGAAEAASPVAFWLARDFELEDSRREQASLVIAADESYRVWINGYAVGAGAYRAHGSADRFLIGPFLQPGPNRILVEVESSRGAGGLLASVRFPNGAGGDDVVLRSDDDWHVLKTADPALLAGRKPLAGRSEEPKVWQRAPTGRFRLSGVVDRPTGLGCGPSDGADEGLSSLRPYSAAARPERVRHVSDPSSWSVVPTVVQRLPGEQAVYDFGRRLHGRLRLIFDEPARTGLLFVSDAEPRVPVPLEEEVGSTEESGLPQNRRPDEVVAPFTARREWHDVRCRSLRYVTLVGMPSLRRIELLDARQATEPAPEEPVLGESGVFGLKPAKPYTAAEEEVWDRLKNHSEL